MWNISRFHKCAFANLSDRLYRVSTENPGNYCLKEGVKVRCPSCGNVFAYTQPESIPLVQQVEESPASLRPPTVRPEVAQVENRHAPPVQMVQVNLPEPRKGNPLGIAALVLGIVAALISWIPLLGLLALPFSALGLLLGVIGLLIAIVGKRSGLAASIVGTAISLGAIVLSFAIIGATSKAISDAMKTEAGPVAHASKPVEASTREPVQLSHPQAEPAVVPPTVVPPLAPEKRDTEWVVAPTPARLSDVEVKVVSAKVAPVALSGPTGEGQSKEPQLILTIEVTNTNQNRKIDYRTWAGADVSFERDFATLKDDFENSYKRITFGNFDRPIRRVVSESMYPGKSPTDVLVFEAPLENIKQLDLDMPGKNVGMKGLFKIRIPAAMIQRLEKTFTRTLAQNKTTWPQPQRRPFSKLRLASPRLQESGKKDRRRTEFG